ncbi:ribosomal protein L29 [Thiovulum sp. ES]|nr:ribosomal protein L29 [Thiovulum sp. ES]
MKFTDLKDKSLDELNKLLDEKKLELFQLKVKKQMSQLQNTAEIRVVRKDIARINTAITALSKEA